MFKRLFGWSPELGFPNDFASAYYEKVLRDWKEQVKKQKLTGEDITDAGRAIARPYFVKHLKKVLIGQEKGIPQIVELALGEPEEVEKIEKEEEKKEVPPPETKPVATEKPKKYVKPKKSAARMARIRALVVPLNEKFKTRLKPSLLDNTSDKFFETWSALDDDRKLKALQALENGYSEEEVLSALEIE